MGKVAEYTELTEAEQQEAIERYIEAHEAEREDEMVYGEYYRG